MEPTHAAGHNGYSRVAATPAVSEPLPTVDGAPPAVGDHLAATGEPDRHPTGVYRVVGHGDGSVTLLHVADPDGRRRHTGRLVAAGSLAGFERTTPPTDGDGVSDRLRDAGWQVRAFLTELRRQPVASTLAAAPLAVGVTDLLPDAAAGLLFVGSLGLAYVGSGRLR